jgi:hypothetical protein
VGVLEELRCPDHWLLEFRFLSLYPQETIADGNAAVIGQIYDFIGELGRGWWQPRDAFVFGMRRARVRDEAWLVEVLDIIRELRALPPDVVRRHCQDHPYRESTGPFLRLDARA